MKKWTLFVMVLVAVSLVLWGCGEKKVEKKEVPPDKVKDPKDPKAKGAKDKGAKDEGAKDDDAKDDDAKDDDAKDDDAKDDDAKDDDDSGEVAAEAHPWASAKEGDMVEFKTHMKMPKMEMDTGMRWTVKSNDGKEVVYKMETMDKNGKVTYTKEDTKMALELNEKYKEMQSKWKKTGTDSISVDGNDVSCDVWEGPTGKAWRSKDVPCGGLVKSVTKFGQTETTMTLVKFVKK